MVKRKGIRIFRINTVLVVVVVVVVVVVTYLL